MSRYHNLKLLHLSNGFRLLSVKCPTKLFSKPTKGHLRDICKWHEVLCVLVFLLIQNSSNIFPSVNSLLALREWAGFLTTQSIVPVYLRAVDRKISQIQPIKHIIRIEFYYFWKVVPAYWWPMILWCCETIKYYIPVHILWMAWIFVYYKLRPISAHLYWTEKRTHFKITLRFLLHSQSKTLHIYSLSMNMSRRRHRTG